MVVGARVEGRFQASVPGVASNSSLFRKTHWFPGTITSVDPGGTCSIRYDDGDFESGVKKRFVRLLSREVAASVEAEEEGLALAAFDEWGFDDALIDESATPFESPWKT